MAKSYEQILQRIASLQAEAEKARRKEIDGVIAELRQAIDHYGLTAADLGLATARTAAKAGRKSLKGSTVPPKYRDAEGRTWSGRGLKPVWLREALAAGKTLADFEVH